MADLDLPESLLWLLDAPMFIDTKQVEAFYDAVLRPESEGLTETLSRSFGHESKVGADLTLGVTVPWFAKAEGTGSVERTRTDDSARETTMRPVVNPYRHLLGLVMHYSTEKLRDRLVLIDSNGQAVEVSGEPRDVAWWTREFSEKPVRALVMLDLPPGSMFIPAALELTDGSTAPLYQEFAGRLQEPGKQAAPRYPGDAAPDDPKRQEYWDWFKEYWKDRAALDTVESAVAGKAIAWIAFRVPIPNSDPRVFLHLHIAARGQYETGTFGYNLISRGWKHGMRIVGTLKSEPDLNVLAIFER